MKISEQLQTTFGNASPKEVEKQVLAKGQSGAAKHFGVNRSTLRDYLYRHDLATRKLKPDKEIKSGITVKPEEVEVTTEATTEIGGDPEKIVRDRGLNPDDWEFVGMTVNEWDSPAGEKLQQLKVNLRRKKAPRLILPARTDGVVYDPPKEQKIDKNGSLFVFCGDDQAPFHDPHLEDKKLQFLSDQQPHTIINMGDTNDFPDISKYKKNPEVDKIVNDCITAGYERLRNERDVCPDTNIKKIIGNHDVRFRDFVINRVPELYGLSRAKIEGQETENVLQVGYLMRLDELGVDLTGEYASYEHGEIKISKNLAARHGWIATKGSGSSALKTLEHLGYSIVVGHTHRLSLVHKTTYDIDGEITVLAAGESGCLCLVDKTGLGYTPNPDWQPGFITAQVWPDGYFKLDTANYVNGNLIWRDNRY